MTRPYNMFRAALLAAGIAAALILQSTAAQAQDIRTAIVAGGCFWCVEADFDKVEGVIDAVSGYSGGTLPDPTYRQVTAGGTGHYEAVKITYDASVLSYPQVLHLFFRSVDPTDAGGQFCDRGESYRTAIFVSDPAERAAAEAAKTAAAAALGQDVVTPILDVAPFYEAEDYHQGYYKGSSIILTRRGPMTQANAYAFYRDSCGRDERVRELWGDEAPFAS
jgi:peptide-methionine (S)-S-oxide reductase